MKGYIILLILITLSTYTIGQPLPFDFPQELLPTTTTLQSDFTPGGGEGGGDSGGGAGGDDDELPPIMTLPPRNLSDPDNYELDLEINLALLFGECPMMINEGEDSLDGQFLNDTGTCIINFFSPAIPSPFSIFNPLRGEKLQEKIDYIDLKLDIVSIIKAPLKLINMMLYTLLELMASVLNFLIAFAGRFFFTYLFYVSILFNTVLGAIDQNRRLSHEDKVYSTAFIIIVATIYTLAGGWAWL